VTHTVDWGELFTPHKQTNKRVNHLITLSDAEEEGVEKAGEGCGAKQKRGRYVPPFLCQEAYTAAETTRDAMAACVDWSEMPTCPKPTLPAS
jgi:hypothetical protein